MKPIPDESDFAFEFPGKSWSGTFGRSARFDAQMEEGGVTLSFARGGKDRERKSVRLHLRYGLFAEILNELTKTASAIPATDRSHRDALAQAASALAAALRPVEQAARPGGKDDLGGMTPDEEVTLLHLLE